MGRVLAEMEQTRPYIPPPTHLRLVDIRLESLPQYSDVHHIPGFGFSS